MSPHTTTLSFKWLAKVEESSCCKVYASLSLCTFPLVPPDTPYSTIRCIRSSRPSSPSIPEKTRCINLPPAAVRGARSCLSAIFLDITTTIPAGPRGVLLFFRCPFSSSSSSCSRSSTIRVTISEVGAHSAFNCAHSLCTYCLTSCALFSSRWASTPILMSTTLSATSAHMASSLFPSTNLPLSG